jgi:hypothetical protein
MLGSLLDFSPGYAEPHLPMRGANPLHGAGGNNMVSFVKVMPEADDPVALTRCIACSGDLAGIPIGRLDLKALDAVVAAEHSFRKRPETIALLLALAHKAEL